MTFAAKIELAPVGTRARNAQKPARGRFLWLWKIQASLSRASRASACTNATAPLVLADLAPCFQAFRLPLGAPGEVPPCMRQRPLGIAGDRHGFPFRVCAPQAVAGFEWPVFECMGLSVRFLNFFPPGMHRFGDDGLSAPVIDMNVAHSLLAPVRQLVERFDGGAAL